MVTLTFVRHASSCGKNQWCKRAPFYLKNSNNNKNSIPLLFLLYINDLPNCLTNCVPWMYADDTHLTYAGDNTGDIESSLNHDLENVKKMVDSKQTYPEHDKNRIYADWIKAEVVCSHKSSNSRD